MVEGIVLFDGPPRQLAYGRYGVHVDAVPVAALKFRERMGLVAEVYHQHVVGDVNVQLLFRQAQICRRAVHVAYYAAGVCRTFHQ